MTIILAAAWFQSANHKNTQTKRIMSYAHYCKPQPITIRQKGSFYGLKRCFVVNVPKIWGEDSCLQIKGLKDYG